MDFVIFTGRVHLDELKHERPLEYERLMASGELEKQMGMHVLPWQYTAARIFGFIALGVGLMLLRADALGAVPGALDRRSERPPVRGRSPRTGARSAPRSRAGARERDVGERLLGYFAVCRGSDARRQAWRPPSRL